MIRQIIYLKSVRGAQPLWKSLALPTAYEYREERTSASTIVLRPCRVYRPISTIVQ